jgi:hypothetical protein
MAKHGPIPPGLCVLHRRDVRPCINPDHLYLGTQKDNMADLTAKRGHERRPHDGGPERRPSKAPEIMRIRMYGHEFVTRVLAVRPMAGVSGPAPPWERNARKPSNTPRIQPTRSPLQSRPYTADERGVPRQ